MNVPSRLTSLYAFVARLFAPISWRGGKHSAKLLREFALAERASVVDMQLAANLTPSAERAAAYIRHALDEWRHAETFALHATRFDGERVPMLVDTEHLFETLGEERFLAFVNMGEARGRAQFIAHRSYLEHASGDDARRMFAALGAILDDEEQHFAYTAALLVGLSDATRATSEVKRMGRRQLWRSWRRMGNASAHHVFSFGAGVLYFLASPLRWGVGERRRYAGHWATSTHGGPSTRSSGRG